MQHAISWFEIPALDLQRAKNFYEAIFEITLQPVSFPDGEMLMFPLDDPMNGVGGSLIKTDIHRPSATEGVMIYLNGNPDVDIALGKVEAAGGKVIVPKTMISEEYGYMAVFTDTEGNRIALHSVPEKYLQ